MLLTGTTGFIGNLFLKYALSKNFEIIDIIRKKSSNINKISKLRNKYNKNYKTVIFSKSKDLQKLKNYNFECFINFATLYKNNHNFEDIPNLVKSNIIFPTEIVDIIHQKTKKIINFGTMMQHTNNSDHNPSNLYSSSKSAFEMILKFFEKKNKKLKIYNIKFYESFHEIDQRKKLIPTLITNYKKNKITYLISKNLELNIIHVEKVIEAIMILLKKKNLNSGSFHLLNKKNTNISKLINKFNGRNKKKIKVYFLKSKRLHKPKINGFKLLPGWKNNLDIEKNILKILENEN